MTLNNKIDFAIVLTVDGANPNGDPLNENRPRQRYDGYGEMSDVCIKRKIRNALQDLGHPILVQSNGNETDEFRSILGRLNGNKEIEEVLKAKDIDSDTVVQTVSKEFFDVRTFGQLLAFKGSNKKGISVGIRGPVSIRTAKSLEPIMINEMQISKSVNGEDSKEKGSDTLGMKYTVDFAIYVVYGSMSPQLAEKTGFSDEDAEILKEAILHIFDNDSSSARPAGSMNVRQLYWWKHDSKLGKQPTGKVHSSLHFKKLVEEEATSFEDYEITHDELDGVQLEIIEY